MATYLFKIYLFSLLILEIGCMSLNFCKSKNDFCKALSSKNRDVIERSVNSFLNSLDSSKDVYANLELIEGWLKSNPCIESAKFIPRIIETRPPIAQFQIVLIENEAIKTNYILKINFDTEFKFYQLLKEEKK